VGVLGKTGDDDGPTVSSLSLLSPVCPLTDAPLFTPVARRHPSAERARRAAEILRGTPRGMEAEEVAQTVQVSDQWVDSSFFLDVCCCFIVRMSAVSD